MLVNLYKAKALTCKVSFNVWSEPMPNNWINDKKLWLREFVDLPQYKFSGGQRK